MQVRCLVLGVGSIAAWTEMGGGSGGIWSGLLLATLPLAVSVFLCLSGLISCVVPYFDWSVGV